MNPDDKDRDIFIRNYYANFLSGPRLEALDEAIAKINMKHVCGMLWTDRDRMKIYTFVDDWIMKTKPGDERNTLLMNFREKIDCTFVHWISIMVVPSLKNKDVDELLVELKKQLSMYKRYTKDVLDIFYDPILDEVAKYSDSEISHESIAEVLFCKEVDYICCTKIGTHVLFELVGDVFFDDKA